MIKSISALSLLAALAMGCAGDNRALAPAGNLSAATLTANQSPFKAALGAFKLNAQPTFPGTGTIPAAGRAGRAGTYDACRTFVVGTADTDAHYKLSYACNKLDDGGGTLKSLVGTYEANFTDPLKKNIEGGYEITYDLDENGYPTNGEPYHRTYKGYAKGQTTATQIIREHDIEAHIIGKDAFVLDWGWRATMKQTITPDDMTNIYVSGSTQFTGFYKLSGLLGGDNNGVMIPEINVTYAISSQELTYDQACARYYKSGSITMSDGTNSVILTYACATATASFNGTVLQWVF